MTSFVDFFTRQKREIDRIVDQTFFRLTESTAAIDALFPTRSYSSKKLLLLKFKRRPLIGSVIGEGAPVPLDRPYTTLTEELLADMKLGHGYEWTPRDYELLAELENYLSSAGARGSQAIEQMKRYFFGNVSDIVPALNAKALILCLKVATSGTCIYQDPLTKIHVSITYPGKISALFPAALSSTARWSQSATADALQNLQDHAELWYNEFGMFPDTLVMHWDNLREIANQAATKAAHVARSALNLDASQVGNIFLEDNVVTDLIRQRTRCRQVIIFDAKYSYKDDAGTVTDAYYLPEDTYFFCEPGNVERAVTPTIENDMRPGVYTITERLQPQIPKREISHGVMNFAPFVGDDRKLAARVVN